MSNNPQDDSRCHRINFSLTADRCFDNGYVEKQPVTLKECCMECYYKEPQENMDRCTDRRDITEINTMLKTALYPKKPTNHASGFNPFPNKPWFLRVFCKSLLKNTVGKREIARNEQFLRFPQCLLPFRKTFLHSHQI